MAVKATAEITLRDQTDAEAIILWHYVSTSASAPSKPNTTSASATPSGWSKSEPSVSSDSDLSKYDYTSLQTVWGDGTCDWGDVNLSASYEAAKRAWNKASSVENELNNLEIGGRNLLLWTGQDESYNTHTAVDRRWMFYSIYGPTVVDGNTVTFTKNSDGLTNNTSGIRVSAMLASGAAACSATSESLSFGLDLKAGDTLTFSCDVKTSGNRVALHAQYYNGSSRWANAGNITECGAPADTDWHRYSHTFTVASNYVSLTALGIYCELTEGVTVSARNFKLERGNKATDWTPAPEDLASASDAVEYIAGTQTAATGSWTGVTRDSSLYVGKTIAYKLPYAGSGSASLQLKDSSGNNVGGNIAVYSMTTRVTTHYPAGSVIQMTYDGTYWRTTGWYNSNNYDRNLHNNYVKAAANVTSGQLVCGTSDGYKPIAASVTFDMSYPILWAAGAWTSGTQYANAYETYPSVNPATTATVESLGKNLMVYVKGQISGNTFTCAASNFLTCKVPTSEDGYFYLPIGIIANDATTKMYFNTSNDLYAYLDGKFRQVTPTEIVASHRIYYRRDVATKPSAPTSWIAEATSNVYNAWTTKVPPLAASTASGQTKYLYLYTCEQRKRLDGTIECTSVQLDENTIVTDGGSLIAYSVTAEHVNFAEATGTQLKLFDPGSPTNYTTVGSSGMNVVKDGTSVALFGETTRLGKADSAHTVQTASATQWFAPDGTTQLAEIKARQNDALLWLGSEDKHIVSSESSSTNNGVTKYYDILQIGSYGSENNHFGSIHMTVGDNGTQTAHIVVGSDANTSSDAELEVVPGQVRLGQNVGLSVGGDIYSDGRLYVVNGVLASSGEALLSGSSAYLYLRDETNNIIRISKTNGKIDFYNGENWVALFYMATTSRTANTVLAAPNGSAGVATFRKLVAADLPQTAWTYINSTASGDTNYVRWRYMSGMVTVQLNYANSAGLAAGTQKQFGTIATAAYRPDATVTASAYLGSSTDHVASMWVDTSGMVYVRALSAATAVFGTITYPLK